MGNHAAGHAMVSVALNLDAENTGMTPLKILDIACEPYRGCDANFDGSAREYDQPFGQLLKRAFLPDAEYDPDEDEDGDWWWDHVIEPFRKRYELC